MEMKIIYIQFLQTPVTNLQYGGLSTRRGRHTLVNCLEEFEPDQPESGIMDTNEQDPVNTTIPSPTQTKRNITRTDSNFKFTHSDIDINIRMF